MSAEEEWIEYQCKSGQTMFVYNKARGEHKWPHGLGKNQEYKIIHGRPVTYKEFSTTSTQTDDNGCNNGCMSIYINTNHGQNTSDVVLPMNLGDLDEHSFPQQSSASNDENNCLDTEAEQRILCATSIHAGNISNDIQVIHVPLKVGDLDEHRFPQQSSASNDENNCLDSEAHDQTVTLTTSIHAINTLNDLQVIPLPPGDLDEHRFPQQSCTSNDENNCFESEPGQMITYTCHASNISDELASLPKQQQSTANEESCCRNMSESYPLITVKQEDNLDKCQCLGKVSNNETTSVLESYSENTVQDNYNRINDDQDEQNLFHAASVSVDGKGGCHSSRIWHQHPFEERCNCDDNSETLRDANKQMHTQKLFKISDILGALQEDVCGDSNGGDGNHDGGSGGDSNGDGIGNANDDGDGNVGNDNDNSRQTSYAYYTLRNIPLDVDNKENDLDSKTEVVELNGVVKLELSGASMLGSNAACVGTLHSDDLSGTTHANNRDSHPNDTLTNSNMNTSSQATNSDTSIVHKNKKRKAQHGTPVIHKNKKRMAQHGNPVVHRNHKKSIEGKGGTTLVPKKNKKTNKAQDHASQVNKENKKKRKTQSDTLVAHKTSNNKSKTKDNTPLVNKKNNKKSKEQDDTAVVHKKNKKTKTNDDTSVVNNKNKKNKTQDDTAVVHKKNKKTKTKDDTSAVNNKNKKTKTQDDTSGVHNKNKKTKIQDDSSVVHKESNKKSKAKDPPTCSVCDKVFKTRSSLNRHLQSLAHQMESLQCNHCKKVFTEKSKLTLHLGTSNAEKLVECPICQEKVSCKGLLAKHIKTHRKDEAFECCHCEKRFLHQAAFVRHAKKHKEEKTYQCSHCDKNFLAKSALRKHTKKHKEIKTFECPVCKNKFYSKKLLKQHLPTHPTKEPSKCPFCEKSFDMKFELNEHIMGVHKNGKRYRCHVCQKEVTQKVQFEAHLRIHTGEKPFECSICNAKYRRKDNLKAHIKIHHCERPFKCPFCDKKFAFRHNMKLHIETYLGKIPFKYLYEYLKPTKQSINSNKPCTTATPQPPAAVMNPPNFTHQGAGQPIATCSTPTEKPAVIPTIPYISIPPETKFGISDGESIKGTCTLELGQAAIIDGHAVKPGHVVIKVKEVYDPNFVPYPDSKECLHSGKLYEWPLSKLIVVHG